MIPLLCLSCHFIGVHAVRTGAKWLKGQLPVTL